MKTTQEKIEQAVQQAVFEQIWHETGRRYVVGAVSNRHVHLSVADKEALFGAGYELKRQKDLKQPGQYACMETVTLVGPKGRIERIRVLGPERPQTQVEVSVTDTYKLGIGAEVRMSGDIAGTPGGVLLAGERRLELTEGVMVSARHLHLSAEQASAYGLKDQDVVRLRSGGARAVVFEEVLVRSGAGHEMEAHVDMDEANAAGMRNGDMLEII
ncbi:MAG: phosphate propanoyltransferase [Christensenella sp.]|uniref:phosphate propanoyltransferase n=1 Tax=Christensenella sp. TaxID=1935934 RepID=UPI002B203221|nr:phosphate propanoyltransferase [Christensenella sp.]MEA5002801.1 phosphate propanoyltransferase [Christensenella sp.]